MSAALFGFVLIGLFSPGPNVVLLTASGARFGFRATVPHILGVALGVGLIAAMAGFGVGALLLARPGLTLALQVAACLWILWMARALWLSDPAARARSERPFTFLQAVLFQWVNPKVWAVALAATAFVAELGPAGQAATLAPTFSTLNLAVCLFWTWAGALLARLLTDPRRWRLMMRIMAVALAAFSVLVFL